MFYPCLSDLVNHGPMVIVGHEIVPVWELFESDTNYHDRPCLTVAKIYPPGQCLHQSRVFDQLPRTLARIHSHSDLKLIRFSVVHFPARDSRLVVTMKKSNE